VVLLSSLDAEGAAPDSPLRMAEEALAASSVRWAALRPTWFLDNFTTGSFPDMTRAGELRLPAGDAKIPFIDARDVAAVAAACMAESGPEGILPLTGRKRSTITMSPARSRPPSGGRSPTGPSPPASSWK
jgi:uncharacterized protein YbjT (DUF2867 family)